MKVRVKKHKIECIGSQELKVMTGGFTGNDPSGNYRFSRDLGFFDTSRSLTLFIGALFAFCLFLFLHFREVHVERPELNSTAERYSVAQVDFEFRDEEATAILRQESRRDIDKIFRVSDKEVRQRRVEFENYLIYNEEWRKLVENSTFEEMYRGVLVLEEYLVKLRITDPRTLQKAKELGLDVSMYQLFTPADPEGGVELPSQVWQSVRERGFQEKDLREESQDLIIRYFQSRVWKLEEDTSAQRHLRKAVQKKVPERYTKVSAGDRLIDQGERVTARHLAMLDAMKEALSDSRKLWHLETLLGSLLLTCVLLYIGWSYFRFNHPQILASNRNLFLVLTVLFLTILLAKTEEFFILRTAGNFSDVVRYPLVVPFAAILLCSLTDAAVATFISAALTVLFTLVLAVEQQGFMLVNLATSLVAVFSSRQLRRRKEVFVVCGKGWLVCAAILIGIHLYENTLWQGVGILFDLLSTLGFLLLCALLVVGILPLLESGFQILTDVTLMEYMDPNHELLRRLTIEAPGTYQHSLVVGTLAEAAALAIGANGLFCRVAALYHDIGKLTTPHYFTENQQGGTNMHQLLTPLESAQVIIAHVAEGVAMGRKAGLPESFIDIIKEHHGTTLVYYFYSKQLDQVGGDKSLVDQKDFRYMGPRPRSKESAVMMIADSFEAASRSLDVANEQTLTELVDRLVAGKANDGQFDQCLLTFEELGVVKRTLVKSMVTSSHSRIKYPHREQERLRLEVHRPPPPDSIAG